jgi:hypothetical protein
MAEKSPYFGLEYFVVGDYYSATIDKRRFETIDQGMAFISDLIGPGVIQGWNLSVDTNLSLTISEGWGMIGRQITKTYGDYTRSLTDNNLYYVWMRGRPGVIGQLSGFSKTASCVYSDTTPPAIPTNLHATQSSTDSITIEWNAVTAIDLAKYLIYRSTNNIDYSLIDESTENSYNDVGLDENTIYYYKIKSVDYSGNYSNFSSVLTSVTSVDSSQPANPSNVKITAGKNLLYLTWNTAPYGNIAKYIAYVTPINVDGTSQGSTLTFETTYDKVDLTVYNLENDQLYSVVLKSVSVNEIESDGVEKKSTPRYYVGPPDIIFVTVDDFENTTSQYRNGLNINWSTYDNPYETFDGYAEILIEEYSPTDVITTSEWIRVAAGVTTKSIEVFLYKKNNSNFYKSIEARFTYYVTVRNVDENGVTSVGKRIKHVARNYVLPETPGNLQITQNQDYSLYFTFDNTKSVFATNYVRILQTLNSVQTELLAFTNIGKSTYYLLAKDFVQNDATYTFEIYCVDEFDNQSDTASVSAQVSIAAQVTTPVPPRTSIFPGDKQNTLTWNIDDATKISTYKVYRALDKFDLTSTDFSLIETLDGDQLTYTDYEVDNNTAYAYFVVATNSLGRSSPNIINNPRTSQAFVVGKPKSVSILPIITDLTASILGSSIEISWQPTGGVFDGYEIYKSIDNKYSFQYLTNVSASTSYYLDQNALLKTSKIYYIIRKYRNEAEPYITESNVDVTNAVILAKITTSNGSATIDKTVARNIAGLEDPIRIETRKVLAEHKHTYNSDTDDRRINLNDQIIVDDWTSLDNQAFITATDISNTTTYEVYLDGKIASEYKIVYLLNKESGKLTFETKLAATGYESDTATYPFSTLPTISVKFGGIEEVQGTLPKNRLQSVSATQITSGKFMKKQLEDFNHDGRIKEKLVPLQLQTVNLDSGYRYSLQDQTEIFGNAIVFYEIIPINSENVDLLASTSDGIYTSADYGNTWTKKISLVTPPSKFYYSEKYKSFFAATNTGFFYGRGETAADFNEWREVVGAENTKIIRDIIEDNNGDIYCSSDLGAYKLRKSVGENIFYLEQLPIFGPISTEGYAMLYDANHGRIIVSNSLGIFESYDGGANWFFSDEFTEQRPIHVLIQDNDYTFALTDFMVWRKSITSQFFERIGVLEDVEISRKMVIWNDRIYISTDIGLVASSPDENIYTNDTVVFEIAYPNLRIKSHRLPATSLNIIDDKLFIGTENSLYISDRPSHIAIHYENTQYLMPTIYVNGIEQKIGYRFTTNDTALGKYLCFDEKQPYGTIVTVANQYQIYTAKYGGWVNDNFISSVTLHLDGISLNQISLAERPADTMQALVLPTYNDRNAHASGASAASTSFESARSELLATNVDSTNAFLSFKNFDKDHVVLTFNYLDRFLSQLYESARVTTITNADGTTTTVDFTPPEFRVLLMNTDTAYDKNYIGSHGVYNEWINTNSSSTSPGKFGNELDATFRLKQELLGGTADLGIQGGGENIAGGLLLPDTASDSSSTTSSTGTSKTSTSIGG